MIVRMILRDIISMIVRMIVRMFVRLIIRDLINVGNHEEIMRMISKIVRVIRRYHDRYDVQ